MSTEARWSGPTSRASKLAEGARLFALSILGLVWVLPLLLIGLNSFKENHAIVRAPFGFDGLTLRPLTEALTSPTFNIMRAYFVTTLLVIVVNVASILACAPAAYVLARRNDRAARVTHIYLLSGAFIPAVVILIPEVFVLRELSLMGSLPGLMLVFVTFTVPISLFAYVPYIRTIPTDLDEAASIDGAGRWRTFWSVIFPLLRPAIVTVAILNTTGVWENFVLPYIILGPGSSHQTVTTAIQGAVGPYQTDYSIIYPNLLLVVTPLMIFYLLMQRQLINGLASGAVRG